MTTDNHDLTEFSTEVLTKGEKRLRRRIKVLNALILVGLLGGIWCTDWRFIGTAVVLGVPLFISLIAYRMVGEELARRSETP